MQMVKAAVVPIAALLFTLPLAACSSESKDDSPSSTLTGTQAATTSTAESGVIVGMFDVGNGRQLYLRCEGTGAPTILLEAGDEDGASTWNKVVPQLSANSRTCAYDRPGNGRSAQVEGCRQLSDFLGDLDALLQSASVDGPYVLVGHSGGGYLMAGFAAQHPDSVAGLVLVETPKAVVIENLPPGIAAEIKCDSARNEEHRDYAAIEHAVWDVRKEIGTFPMTIISNDWGQSAETIDDETNVQDQRGWLVLSPNSKQVVVTSGHEVQDDDPALVIREILAVLEAARG
jgi:alpha/beta hydrolase fold